MRMGIHQSSLADACADADHVLWYSPPSLEWDLDTIVNQSHQAMEKCVDIETIVNKTTDIITECRSQPVHVVVMSNGGFGNIFSLLKEQLQ
jgi:UDP-N-acetylmuramate: L-alanyl-gamma-D-glutamyl-meso-diaminopimelate ligase